MQTNGPYGGCVKSLLEVDTALFGGTWGAGIFKSADSGQTWIFKGSGMENALVSTLIRQGSVLLAGTNCSIYSSFDSGETWGKVYDTIFVKDMVCNDSLIFTGSTDRGITISSDSGQTWVVSNQGLPDPCAYMVFIDGNTVYAGITDHGLYRSTTWGTQWSFCGIVSTTPRSMLRFGEYLLAGTGANIYRSRDNGYTWLTCLNVYAPVNDLISDTTGIYAATEGAGVYFSADSGKTWTQKNTGLTDLEVNDLQLYGNVFFAGTNHKALFCSSDQCGNWELSNDGVSNNQILTLFHYNNNIYAGAASMYAAGSVNNGLFQTSDNGISWTFLGLDQPMAYYIGSCFRNSSYLFASAYDSLYRTTVDSICWTSVKSFPASFIQCVNGMDGVLFAGTVGYGLFRSSDHGSSWSYCDLGINNARILTVYTSATRVYVTEFDNGVFYSDDMGVTWVCIGKPVDQPVHFLASNQNYLFAGTKFFGIYRTPDEGSSWEEITNGLAWYGNTGMVSAQDMVFLSTDPGGIYYSVNDGDLWSQWNYGLGSENTGCIVYQNDTLFTGAGKTGLWKRSTQEIMGFKLVNQDAGLIKLLPNPNEGIFRLIADEIVKPPYLVEIFTMSGSRIFSEIPQRVNDGWIDLRHFPKGIYLLTVKTGTGTYSAKVIVF